jgi:hypothetical protein
MIGAAKLNPKKILRRLCAVRGSVILLYKRVIYSREIVDRRGKPKSYPSLASCMAARDI